MVLIKTIGGGSARAKASRQAARSGIWVPARHLTRIQESSQLFAVKEQEQEQEQEEEEEEEEVEDYSSIYNTQYCLFADFFKFFLFTITIVMVPYNLRN